VAGSPFTGGTLPGSIASTGNSLTLRFVSDANPATVASGFKLNWVAQWDEQPPVMPQLKLSKVILFNKADYEAMNASEPDPFSSTSPLWDLENTFNTSSRIFNAAWFIANQQEIEAKSLRSVEFVQDYSLARNYHNNIHVEANNTTKLDNPSEVQNQVVVNDYTKSGKLTLNKIVFREEGYRQIEPAYLLDYNATLAADNPDYDLRQTDHDGLFKSNMSAAGLSSYRTAASKDGADAWSLRKITRPLGEEISFTYESDDYRFVLQDDMSAGFSGPVMIYPIASATTVVTDLGSSWDITLEDNVTDFTELVNNAPAGTGLEIHIPFENGNGACAVANVKHLAHGHGNITLGSPIAVS
ncbi:MAG: hypothetical protein AAGB22_15355, partial [Bacteroidota bacterium]